MTDAILKRRRGGQPGNTNALRTGRHTARRKAGQRDVRACLRDMRALMRELRRMHAGQPPIHPVFVMREDQRAAGGPPQKLRNE